METQAPCNTGYERTVDTCVAHMNDTIPAVFWIVMTLFVIISIGVAVDTYAKRHTVA